MKPDHPDEKVHDYGVSDNSLAKLIAEPLDLLVIGGDITYRLAFAVYLSYL